MSVPLLRSTPVLYCLCLMVLSLLTLPCTGHAAKALTIDINGPGQRRINMTLATPHSASDSPVPAIARKLETYLKQNMELLPFLRLVPQQEVLGGTTLQGVTRNKIDFKRFTLSKVDIVITTGWSKTDEGKNRVEIRAYELFTRNLLVGKAYLRTTDKDIAQVADMFCDAFMTELTGRSGFFNSRLAFTRKGQGNIREIWTVTPQGRELERITFFDGASISPAWSPSGRYLAFAHHGTQAHTLGIWDTRTSRIFRTSLPGTTIGGLAFTPENRLAVALSRGNMDIFLLSTDLTKIAQTLVKSWAIDVSPGFSHDGRYITYTSDRQGTPQVFITDTTTQTSKRLTMKGKYNTSPSLSPDGQLVAFSRRTPQGHRIFVINRQTGAEKQITFGPGSDEEPAFSPDGYFIVFSSDKTGTYQLYLTTIHGNEPTRINTGKQAATHPAFGPRYTR